MGVAASIVSAVLKSVTEDKFGNGLAKELIGISIDGISEKGINEITDFINGAKSKIDSILSKENMKSMRISEDIIDYVVTEIKDLFSKISITDEVFRQCKYDSMNLSAFLWNEYIEYKNEYVECESEVKRCLFDVAEALIKLVRESENFEKDVLIHISNSVDDFNIGLKNISDYLKDNFGKLDDNSQIVLNILLTILEQIQKVNMQGNETISITDEKNKFKNNKKGDYIKNWNSRLFLHVNNDENPITLADAFIVQKFDCHISIDNIKISDKDLLTDSLKKFIDYDKSSNLLITGSPGIGKTSIISWIANRYICNDDIIVLRFRDWNNKDLQQGLLNAIYHSLNCGKNSLENKILVLDGFDEIKLVSKRNNLIREFLNDCMDFDNLKIIVTSRHNYLFTYDFQIHFEILPFNILQIQEFYQIIKGVELDKNKIDYDNLDVLGIPVILYMAIMVNIDLTTKATRPELYSRIFAKKGGIFDRLNFKGSGYDNGFQPLRDKENVNRYLGFLQQVAFLMFEKDNLVLTKNEYDIPELEIQGEKLNVIEFPIKPLFESDGYNIEFIHKSIYEYFVSEYFLMRIQQVLNKSKEDIAGDFGCMLERNLLSNEILEYLKFKIRGKVVNVFDSIYESFQLMIRDGMTYYTDNIDQNIIDCEMNVFNNMLNIIHLWNKSILELDRDFINYINCNKILNFQNNKNKINLRNVSFKEKYLRYIVLRGVDLSYADLSHIDLQSADLSYSKLRSTNLNYAELRSANLSYSDLQSAELENTNLSKANLRGTIWKKMISKK